MKKLLIALLALGLMSCASISSTLKSTARADLYTYSGIPYGVCSAFAVDANTILTASHCASEMTRGGQVMVAGKYAHLVKIDYTNDVARLFIPNHGLKPLKIASSVDQGDEIWIVGYPLGVGAPIITHGWVGGWYKQFIVVSAAATGGNSGSPILNDRNEVVSMLVAGPHYPHIGLGVPLEAIREIMK